MEAIEKQVHELYAQSDMNNARIILICLAKNYDLSLDPCYVAAAYSRHLTGQRDPVCDLVRGGMLFLELYYCAQGRTNAEIDDIVKHFVQSFHQYFGSLECRDLFSPAKSSSSFCPPICESLLCEVFEYICQIIEQVSVTQDPD